MSLFYYVRHGATDDNLAGIVSGGERDVPLSTLGFQQAEQLAASEAVQALKGKITTIACSPQQRARQTADILNQTLGASLTIIKTLHEWDVGEWTGKPHQPYSDHLFDWTHDPPGGETREQFHARSIGALTQSLACPGPVLMVAHGAVWWRIAHHLEMPVTLLPNCSLTAVQHAAKPASADLLFKPA